MSLKLLNDLLSEYTRAYTKELEVDTSLVRVVCTVDGKEYEVTHHLSHYDKIEPKIELTLKAIESDDD